jgi:hypothetical protein
MECLVNRAFLALCTGLAVVSFVFSATASAEQNPREDYCLQNASACIDQCDRYNIHLWGISWPTPLTALCVGECSAAYVGCLMMRFRVGV